MAVALKAPKESSGIDTLANLFLGKTTSTGSSGSSTQQNSGGISTSGTVTTSENVSKEAIDAVVNDILSGSQGLAAVSSGQKRAGLYNSTTNQLLVNDLIAKTAAEGAKLNKSTTVATNNVQADNRAVTSNENKSQTVTQKAPASAGKTAAGLGLLQLIPSDLKQSAMKSIGLGGTAKPAVANAGANIGGGSTSSSGDPTETDVAEYMARQGEVAQINPISNTQSVIGSTPGIGTNLDSQSVSGFAGNGGFLGGYEDAGIGYSDTGGGIDITGALDFSGGSDSVDVSGGAEWTPDLTNDYNLEFGEEIDYGQFFSEGGKVSKESLYERRRAALDAAEDATVKGSNTDTAYQERMKEQTKEEKKGGFFQRLIPKFAQGGIVRLTAAKEDDSTTRYTHDATGRKNSYSDPRSAKYVPEFNGGGPTPKRDRYATGGVVDLTNLGLRRRPEDGAVNSPLTVSGGTQSVPTTLAPRGNASKPDLSGRDGGTSSVNVAGTAAGARNLIPVSRMRDDSNPAAGQGENTMGEGVTPGTGSTLGLGATSANVAGLGLSAAGMGAPGMVGLANASNNNQAVGAFATAVASVLGGPIAGLVVNALMSNAASSDSDSGGFVGEAVEGGMSTAGAPGSIGMSTTADLLGATDPLGSIGFSSSYGGVDLSTLGISAEGNGSDAGTGGNADGGTGDTGSDGTGGGGTGDGDGGSGGDVGYRKGGKLKGPGTGTSDSIHIRVSDGEYITKAKSVALFGEEFMDAVNEGDPSKALEEMMVKGLIGGKRR